MKTTNSTVSKNEKNGFNITVNLGDKFVPFKDKKMVKLNTYNYSERLNANGLPYVNNFDVFVPDSVFDIRGLRRAELLNIRGYINQRTKKIVVQEVNPETGRKKLYDRYINESYFVATKIVVLAQKPNNELLQPIQSKVMQTA